MEMPERDDGQATARYAGRGASRAAISRPAAEKGRPVPNHGVSHKTGMLNKVYGRRKLTRREERDLEVEIQFMEGIVQRDPQFVEALQVLGTDYARRGDFHERHHAGCGEHVRKGVGRLARDRAREVGRVDGSAHAGARARLQPVHFEESLAANHNPPSRANPSARRPDYSATLTPEPPISFGTSFIFGNPSLIRSFVS